jgi:hypothetical protein
MMNANLLKTIEDQARLEGLRYEMRLAARLRDILLIHEITDITFNQIKSLTFVLNNLFESWGKMNSTNLSELSSMLLSVNLSWIPVTHKARKDIQDYKQSLNIK